MKQFELQKTLNLLNVLHFLNLERKDDSIKIEIDHLEQNFFFLLTREKDGKRVIVVEIIDLLTEKFKIVEVLDLKEQIEKPCFKFFEQKNSIFYW